MKNNPVYVYDITIPKENISVEDLKIFFDTVAKKWTFQTEKGAETGYEHYQCRVSLNKKIRLNQCIDIFKEVKGHVSVTCAKNMGNDFYVLKEDTRIDGPWTNVKMFIPRDVKKMTNLYPWQEKLLELIKTEEDRIIHYIYDPDGNKGKSSFVRYCTVYKHALSMPPINDAKDICQAVCSMGESPCYFIDMPRSMPKDKLQSLYAAIEQVKTGTVYDTRYKFKQLIMDPPNVVIFANVLPNYALLSKDRWTMWTIEELDLKALPL